MTNDRSADDPGSGWNAGELAQRAVDSFLLLVRRGTAFAFGVLVIVTLICVAAFVTGLAALSDEMETVWIVIGGFGAFVAIGSVALAMFRLWIVKQVAGRLIGEVRRLISSDPQTERVVIETVESSDRVQDQSAVVMSRQFFAMSDAVGDRRGDFVAVGTALRAITTFPLLILLAAGITLAYAVLGALFTISMLL